MATQTKKPTPATDALAEARQRQAERYRQLLRRDKLTADQANELFDLAAKLDRHVGGLTVAEAVEHDRGTIAAAAEHAAAIEAAPDTLKAREDQAAAVLDAAEKLAKARAALVEAIESFESADLAATNAARASASLRQLRGDDVLFDAEPIANIDASPSESVAQARRIRAADFPKLTTPRLAIPQPPIPEEQRDEADAEAVRQRQTAADRAWLNQSSPAHAG